LHALARPRSPTRADKGFPRLYVNAGAVETLLDSAQDLAHIAKVDGVEVTLSVVDGMQYVFPLLAGRAAAADEAPQRQVVQGRLGASRKRRPVRTEPALHDSMELGSGRCTRWRVPAQAHT